MKRPGTFPPPAAYLRFAQAILLDAAQIGGEGQLRDKRRAAPIGGQSTRVQVGDAPSVECRSVIAGKDVALGLGEIGVVVAQIKRKRLIGEAYAGVPGPVALVGNPARERSIAHCWYGRGKNRAIEVVAGTERPVPNIAGD